MNTRCVRHGQVEIGVVEHEGHEFAAFGATIVGKDITAYTRLDHGEISLTTWSGQTMVACRSETVATFCDGSLALLFRLPRSRYLVGYALGDDGMLFRGELLDTSTAEKAKATAVAISDYWSEKDADEEEVGCGGE